MADPIGATGTALAVASALYNTCRAISDVIESYRTAPQEYRDLAAELKGLSAVLDSLQGTLRNSDDPALTQAQKDELHSPLDTCNKICNDFKAKLTAMTSRSDADHTAVWDRLRLHFNKSDVRLLREKLSSTKGTVQVALGVSTLKSIAKSQTDLDMFQATIATTLSQLSGKIEAMALAVDSLSIVGSSISPHDVEAVKTALNEHGRLLTECLRFCTGAMGAASTVSSGTQVKYAKAIEDAINVIGNIGLEPGTGARPDVVVERAEAEGRSVMGVGNISTEALKVLASVR